MKMTKYKANELPELTVDQENNLTKMGELSDDSIDLSDIPEVKDWTAAIRGSIVLKSDISNTDLVKPNILAKFKDRAEATGGNYQEMINDALEEYLIDH